MLPHTASAAPRVHTRTGVRRASARLHSWDLAHCLGRGAFAEVFAARPTGASNQAAQPPSQYDYAIKVLRHPLCNDATARAAFRNEAVLGRTISHPHLVPILSADTQSKTPFLVMPNLRGATLSDALSQHGAISVAHSLWIVRQLAEALAAVHDAGWIHGDVKSANVMIAADGHVTLFDLGFANAIERGQPNLPRVLRGTLGYLAPELLTSRTCIAGASDVYGLGITLFEMLTGRLPFDSESDERLAESHVREMPPSPRHFVPSLPRELAHLVTRMLAKSPDRRPSADELISLFTGLEIEFFALRGYNSANT